MEIRNLVTFLKVTELNSFSKAAEALDYSQSAVTVQIQQLERELGVRLFDRIGKNVSITQYGKNFISYARDIVSAVARAQVFASEETELTGMVQVGTLNSLMTASFSDIVPAFRQRFPHVMMRLHADMVASLKDKLLKNAAEEAQRILRDAKETADQTIKQINKLSADSGLNKQLEAQRAKLREKLKEADDKLAIKAKGPSQPISPKKLKVGDGVKVLSMGLKGTVSTLPNARGDLYVQMGILRSLVNVKDLELLSEQDITGPSIPSSGGGKFSGKGRGTGSSNIKVSKSASISPEVNLIGMTVDEAMPVMEKYLDDAYLAHLTTVRVVHGRGTGALKNAVHTRLKKLKYVKEFRLGVFGEGDSGVTIVTFK